MKSDGGERFGRRLSAVAFADVAQFSRHVARDEVGTLEHWSVLRENVLEPLFLEHKGTFSEVAGDALLAEFPSVVYALRWAIAVQRRVRTLEPGAGEAPLSLRISVNVDDVLFDGDSVRGDGVNIAARIHQAAKPGEIVVTSIVRELSGGRVPVRFNDLGTPKLKNIDRIVHVYQIDWEDLDANSALHHPHLTWTSRPTLAVMPFVKAGDPQGSDYFSQGITEDIIAGLSRSRSLHVIARGSMIRYADRTRSIADVAAELGVSYVLEGSVRRSGDRLRITTELVDVSRNCAIWSNRFDGAATDLFDFQDGIVRSIVGALVPRLKAVEIERVRDRPTSSLDAYDCVLKADALLYSFTPESYRASGIALERARELDPSYAQAWAWSAWRLVFVVGELKSSDAAKDRAMATEMSRRAIALDPEDSFCLSVAAHQLSFAEGQPDEALHLFDTALRLDENCAFAWGLSGVTLAYLGRAKEARERFRNAFTLSPFDRMNFFWWSGYGLNEFVDARTDEAVAWLRKSHHTNPRFEATLRLLAAAQAQAGCLDEARQTAGNLLRIDPDFRVSRLLSWYPLKRPDDLERLRTGLLAAGLPP